MNICLDLSPAVHQKAGLGRYAGTLAEHLSERDHANAYTLFSYGHFDSERLPASLRALPRANVPLGARPWRMGVWAAHAIGLSLDSALPPIDVFHATEHLLPPLRRARTVLTLHDLIFHFFPEYHLPLNRWFLASTMPRFLRRADAIIAISEQTRRDAIRVYNVPPDKITVIYEGVSPSLVPVADPDRLAEARRRWAKAQPFILFVSTIEPRKNLVTLVDALRQLRARGCPHRLVVVGRKGWLYQATFDRVKQTGMEDAVDFVGFVPDQDLRALYGACDAFVFPSLYEGFGLTPLEAMACGAPVVASNTSSLPEVLGNAALLVDPRDPGEIASAVERVLGDAALRAELCARGLKRAGEFSWDRAARETLAVYERVARAGKPSEIKQSALG